MGEKEQWRIGPGWMQRGKVASMGSGVSSGNTMMVRKGSGSDITIFFPFPPTRRGLAAGPRAHLSSNKVEIETCSEFKGMALKKASPVQ